jgi:ceramide glucosyltransferase
MNPGHEFSGMHGLFIWIRIVLAIACLLGDAYYLFAIVAAREFFARRRPVDRDFHPSVSILKPLRGLDPDAFRSLSSFFHQDYPDYEVIFGLESPDDPALAVVRRIMSDHPETPARIVFYTAPAEGSPKVASLAHAALSSRHPLLLVSDADIRVGPQHLRAMVQPMCDPHVGVVTCLYRSEGSGLSGRLDALGLSTEFQRDALVARKVEGISFAMGSGILIRRSVLEAIGGFESVANYLADDFLLGNLPTRHGYRVEFAHEVVDHALATRTFGDLIRHQLRWNRGIRVSRPGGYAGLVFTHGAALSFLALAVERGSSLGWGLFGSGVALSMLSAWLITGRLLDDAGTRRALWAVPLRDVLSFFLWIGGMFGSTVDWRGRRFHLGRNGALTPRGTVSGGAAGEDLRSMPPARSVSRG